MSNDDSSVSVHVMRPGDRKAWTMYFVDPVTGKRVRRSTGTTQRRAAERKAAAWEKELNEGAAPNTPRLTWQEFRERYDIEKLAGMATKTAITADTAFNHLERIIEPAYLRAVTEAALGRFVAQLRQEGMRETTIAVHLRMIKAALRWATRRKLLPRAPHVEIPKPAKQQKIMRGRALVQEEFERMLMAAESHRNAAWARFLEGLWFSGLRLSEAVALSWGDDAAFAVDLSGKHPRFRIYAEAQKARRDQYLPMTPDFARLLLKTHEAQRRGRVFPLLSKRTGKPLTTKTIGKTISRIGEKAGVVTKQEPLEFASAHDLRRSFGKRWSLRVKPVVLQQLMRHRSLDTTMKYYVDHDADDVSALLWADDAARSQNRSQTAGPVTRRKRKAAERADATCNRDET